IPNFLVTAVPDTRSSRSVPRSLRPATPPAAAIFPSTIHTPPTPVETVTYASDFAPLPAPAYASPNPAHAASLTTCVGTPRAPVSSRTIFVPSHARRLRASDSTPVSLTLPEMQPETAVIFSLLTHSRASATNCAIPSFGSCGVFIFLTSPNTSPATAATRILVPPISITMYMVEIIEPQPRRRNRFSALLYREDSGPMSAYRLYQRRSTRSPASASPSRNPRAQASKQSPPLPLPGCRPP